MILCLSKVTAGIDKEVRGVYRHRTRYKGHGSGNRRKAGKNRNYRPGEHSCFQRGDLQHTSRDGHNYMPFDGSQAIKIEERSKESFAEPEILSPTNFENVHGLCPVLYS